MDQPRFIIEAAEAEKMAEESGLTVLQLLPTLVNSARSLARSPISNYDVGAVALGSSGRIFLGGNLEFSGLPLHHSIHAEQFLIANLLLNNESNLNYVAVSAAPCGHCRQFFQEIRDAPNIKILVTDNTNDQVYESLSQLLPHRFGPENLLDEDVPLALEPHYNHLYFRSNSDSDIIYDGISGTACDDLKFEALEAANKSHAPYSTCPSGVALLDCEGKVYRGSYMESVAHNPSLGPVQAAFVAYVVGGGGAYDNILAAALVEKEVTSVRQEHTARLLLQLVSPKCEFKVFNCIQKPC